MMIRLVAPFVFVAAAGACASAPRGQELTSVVHGRTSCAGSRSADTTVYDTTQVDQKPIARSGPRLTYPADARQHQIEGRVLFSLIVKTNGSVDPSSIAVVQSVQPDLDAEARRWVDRASFWPGCLNGRPVRVRVLIPIDFRILG